MCRLLVLAIIIGSRAIGATSVALPQSAVPLCPAPAGVQQYGHLINLPEPIRNKLLTDDAMSDPGGPFNPTDVEDGRPMRRLIFIWQADTRWIVVAEEGGYAYNIVAYAFDFDTQNHSARLATSEPALDRKSACANAIRLLKSR